MVLKIETNDALKSFCAQLRKQPFITVDTEFIRQRTYRAILCLIQIATPDGLSACVDPLAKDLNLAPLLKIMKNKKILKVFHSARQDLEIFYELMKDLPKPLFDTQIAAMVCGLGENISYHNIVSHYLNIDLDKSLRATDWMARPLTEKQLDYAVADVTHLVHVYEKMKQELEQKKRTSWFADEMNELLDPAVYEINPMDMWKRLKPASTRPEYLAVLQALCAWREEKAVKLNRPRRHILRDEVILDLAALSPTCPEDFEHFRSKKEFSPKHEYATEVMKCVKKALALSEEKMPHMEREKNLTSDQHSIKEALKLLLNIVSDQIGVATKIIASSEELNLLACEEKPAIRAMVGWRFDVFGKKAKAFKKGKLFLSFNPKTKQIVFEEK